MPTPRTYDPPHAPIDLPDDYEPALSGDGDASYLATLLTGLAVGILLGLALGELWSLVAP